MVEPISVGNAAIAAVAALLGSYEMWLYVRDRRRREHLWLTVLCFAAAAHALLVVVHYNAPLAWIPTINRLEGLALVTISHLIPVLAASVTGRPLPTPRWLLPVTFVALVVLTLSPWSVTGIELRDMWLLSEPFARRHDGVVVVIGYTYGYLLAMLGSYWFIRFAAQPKDRFYFGAGLSIWALAVGVDILSGLVLDPMLPLMLQYGFLGFVLMLIARHSDLYMRSLSEVEKNFRTVIERSPDAVAVVRGGQLVYGNGALAQAVGVESGEQLTGVDVSTLFVDGSVVRRELESERPRPCEAQLVDPAGRTMEVELVFIRAEIDRRPSTVVLARDISARKQLTARLVEMDRVVTVGTLAAGVGHEINNPLAYLILNLEEVKRRLEDDATLERSDLVDDVTAAYDAAERVRAIVRSLRSMSLARGEDAQLSLADVIRSSVTLTRNEVSQRARLVLELDDDAAVVGNEARLGQVFVNLLLNAAQSIEGGVPDENEVVVRLRTVEDSVEFEVSDTGAGIAPNHVARIFDPFFSTKIGVGSGLGLSICQATMRAIGGELSVASVEGEGTTFTGRLPIADRVSAPPERRSAPELERSTEARVLVVDDEPELLRALGRTLRRSAAVETASSGREAIAMLSAGAQFDLILSDVVMPDGTGMDLYAWIEGERPDLASRVVFMTGGAFTPEAVEFTEMLDVPVFEKPLDLDRVRALIRDCVVD